MSKNETYDAVLVKDMDPLHEFMTCLMGTRTENEAVVNLEIEMSALRSYIEEKNSSNPDFRYTFFHAVLAALGRTTQARPVMNYFIRGGKFWQRKWISFSFVAKKKKIDGAEEALVMTKYKTEVEQSPIEQIYSSVSKDVKEVRRSQETKDDTMVFIGKLLKLPGLLFNLVMSIIRKLDAKGKLPKSMANANPYYSTYFVSNLGSIKMDATYHHLINFGSNSIFVITGEIFTKEDGKEYLPISFTIDERIGDGVYFSKTLKIFKALLLNPSLLDVPANQEIDFSKYIEVLK